MENLSINLYNVVMGRVFNGLDFFYASRLDAKHNTISIITNIFF